MKNPSKDKPPQAQMPTQNRLNKTQVPPKPVESLENTYYGQGKTIEPKQTQLPPRAGSSQKISYKVEENMTNSKIQEAKRGLQLLKKKMSRNGMSRDKNSSVERQDHQQEQPARKTIYRPQNEQEEYVQPQPKRASQKIIEKQPPREEVKKTPPVPTKGFAAERSPPIQTKNQPMEQRPIRRAPKSEFVNEAQEVPLKGNQDFMAILEQAMAKEASKGGASSNTRNIKPAKKMPSYQQEDAQIQLVECSKGCGRQFNTEVIAKHQKVCEKVFQSKRKAFNAAAQRQVEGEQIKQPPPPPPSSNKPIASKKSPPPAKESKVPKWKLESAAFRAGIKAGRGQTLTAEEKAVQEQASNMTQCNYCGRKFNADAAKRHIPICETKAKQLPSKTIKKK